MRRFLFILTDLKYERTMKAAERTTEKYLSKLKLQLQAA